jgi:hypothetical protein
MPRSRQLLCVAYAGIAALALLATWSQNLAFFAEGEGAAAGFVSATGRFWAATYANPASRSITIDLVLLIVPLLAWMVIEARRLGIRFVWLYFALGCLVAISVTFPLFLIARERRLAVRGEAPTELGIGAGDGAALVAIGAGVAALAVWTIGR